ncbi:MAG TPA: F0F1 ATP synthase subunit epsilon [Lapidilactobacillus dextrinicus]|uniref:ATP synthase epsilon chain n=1 Tax=Lapidilactobacillus dextrinicus TaxID=51664 RepID=A0A921B2P1_9LACO|nr:F0F1 ATP synthase subunit epsilon [Lapidilactobacillus dextrinicus]HJE14514.1 F0F1 ATP synthase subunit epsilon [Lapidilactobacillus dextrinicus]
MAENTKNVVTVNIVTPDGVVYDHHANLLVACAIDGDLGIMANHEPIIAPLKIGEVRVKRTDDPNHEDAIAVNGGFLEVNNNIASIVADSAERARNIDVTRAEHARERAQQKIKAAEAKHDTDEIARAQIALNRAINRINVSKHRG